MALDDAVPRVLVSDIRMPGESGIELLYQVRQKCPTLPVIIMTAYSDLDSAVSAFQGGAFEYLPKPFDLSQAIGLIRRAVSENDVREAPAEVAARRAGHAGAGAGHAGGVPGNRPLVPVGRDGACHG